MNRLWQGDGLPVILNKIPKNETSWEQPKAQTIQNYMNRQTNEPLHELTNEPLTRWCDKRTPTKALVLLSHSTSDLRPYPHQRFRTWIKYTISSPSDNFLFSTRRLQISQWTEGRTRRRRLQKSLQGPSKETWRKRYKNTRRQKNQKCRRSKM